MKTAVRHLAAALALALPAAGQSFNVDCGHPLAIAPSYGAGAGQAGYWNQLASVGSILALRDLAGQPTGATAISWQGCTDWTCSDCAPQNCVGLTGTADDLALLGSWMTANCPGGEHMVVLYDLAPGRYALHVYTYGCPNPAPTSLVIIGGGGTIQATPSPSVFQGDWSSFAYPRYALEVGANGVLSIRCWSAETSGLAGFQLVKLAETGTVRCPGDGSVAPCPCDNSGLLGHGCRNSARPEGAELRAFGAASLSFDSLGLRSAFELSNAMSIALQGSQSDAPQPFGDGLRCAGGALKRLGFEVADLTGTFRFPKIGGASISARSAALGDPLAPGTMRVYQVYYRDFSTFCPDPQGSTFNASNSVEVVWAQ